MGDFKGVRVGVNVVDLEGAVDGDFDGEFEGEFDGKVDEKFDGDFEGAVDGTFDGEDDGDTVELKVFNKESGDSVDTELSPTP